MEEIFEFYLEFDLILEKVNSGWSNFNLLKSICIIENINLNVLNLIQK